MSIESKLEQSYTAVLLGGETTTDETVIRLNSKVMEQQARVLEGADGDANEVEQIPMPHILLTAKRGGEAIPNTGIFEMELTIEVSDNAEREGSDGGRLDAIFTAAAMPLYYSDLKTRMTNSQIHCYGMPRRADSAEQSSTGTITTRRVTASFFCCEL